jgi:hypothetical protein
LASTDYNVNLAKRRISSLHNYFNEYQNGVLLPYINNTTTDGGSISFFDVDVGELKAKPNVSDDYYDTKNSIYNPAAAFERKIQIIAFSTISSDKDLKKEATNNIQNGAQPITSNSAQGAFAVQVRVHSQLASAQATQSSLKSFFKQPVVIVNEDGVYKVRVSGYNTYDEAKLAFPKLHELGFADAFIVSPK